VWTFPVKWNHSRVNILSQVKSLFLTTSTYFFPVKALLLNDEVSITLMLSALNRTQAVRLCSFCDHHNRSNTPRQNTFSLTFPTFLDFTLNIVKFPDFSRFSKFGGLPTVYMHAHIHCVSKKRPAFIFCDNFSKCWPIFARNSIYAKRAYAIAIPSVRLSHGWFMQKRL